KSIISQLKALESSHSDTEDPEILRTDAAKVENLKRKRQESDDIDFNFPRSKVLRALLAVLEQIDDGNIDEDSNASVAKELVSIAFHGIRDTNDAEIPIPNTYDQAIKDPTYGELWKKAIDEEISSLQINHTWKEEVAPPETNLVGTKWVFSIKYRPDSSLDRFKARLVARGFSQQYGVDYTETFAPTVQMT
ncbi:hypothetical protein K3495_g17192, partial [Podosphaera aphanis]